MSDKTDNVREIPVSFEEWTEAGKAPEPDIHRTTLFVVENPTDWTVWSVSDIPINEVNRINSPALIKTRDDRYIWVQAHHFWTFKSSNEFVNNSIKTYESVDEPTKIIYI